MLYPILFWNNWHDILCWILRWRYCHNIRDFNMKSEIELYSEIEYLTEKAFELNSIIKEEDSKIANNLLEIDLMKVQERIKTLRWVIKE